MKKRFATALVSLVLMGAMFASPAMAQPYAARMLPMSGGIERHPEIRKAINALERAKDDLQEAARDYCGHRAEALEATDNAIRQLRLALESDRAAIEPLGISPSTVLMEKVSYTEAGYMEGRELHPKIREAVNALERARNDLQHAAHDFHGHREAALDATDRALTQLRAALLCDRR
jgi:hypothetical protein